MIYVMIYVMISIESCSCHVWKFWSGQKIRKHKYHKYSTTSNQLFCIWWPSATSRPARRPWGHAPHQFSKVPAAQLSWVTMSCHELPWIAKWNLDGFYPRWSKVQTACHICNGFLYSTNDVIPCYSNIFHYYLQYALSRRVEIFEVSSNPCEWKVRKTWKAFEGHYTIAVKTSGKRP